MVSVTQQEMPRNGSGYWAVGNFFRHRGSRATICAAFIARSRVEPALAAGVVDQAFGVFASCQPQLCGQRANVSPDPYHFLDVKGRLHKGVG
jgi:hypothetical protein